MPKKATLAFMCIFIVLHVFISNLHAQISQVFREECVGRYVLAFPGEVEVAVYVPEALKAPMENPIRFDDGEPASRSEFVYNGEFYITSSVDSSIYRKYMNFISGRSGGSGGDVAVAWSVGLMGARGWSAKESAGFVVYKDGRIFNYFYSNARNMDEAKNISYKIASNFQTRNLYEIPKTKGVCLPFSFVADDGGDEFRRIGVTFRLKDHPDVTVLFLDAKAQSYSYDARMTSRQKNEFVWRDLYQVGKSVKFHGIPFRPVKFASRKGVASFGTITRSDGSSDYGYLVTVQGDPTAAVDTPNLLLFVEQHTKQANGHSPISAEEFERIAQDIAASVQLRPVN